MKIKQFIRNIKIQELGIEKLSNYEQEILDFLNEHLSNLNSYNSHEYPTTLFFGKNTQNIILEYRPFNGRLLIKQEIHWFFNKKMYSSGEIINIIQWWIGDVYQIDIKSIGFLIINNYQPKLSLS